MWVAWRCVGLECEVGRQGDGNKNSGDEGNGGFWGRIGAKWSSVDEKVVREAPRSKLGSGSGKRVGENKKKQKIKILTEQKCLIGDS